MNVLEPDSALPAADPQESVLPIPAGQDALPSMPSEPTSRPAEVLRCSSNLGDLSSDPPFRGTIEVIDRDGMRGWCINTRHIRTPVRLLVAFCGIDLCEVRTDVLRPDVQQAIRRRCSPGFEVNWSSCRFDKIDIEALAEQVQANPDGDAMLEIRTLDGGVHLPRALSLMQLTNSAMLGVITGADGEAVFLDDGVPPNDDPAQGGHDQAHRADDVEGYFDRVDGPNVSGWARWRDQEGPLTVELLVDSTVVATALATNPRDDLAAQGIENCAYRLTIPTNCYDGAEHRIEVKVAESDILLIGSPGYRRLTLVEDGRWSITGQQISGWLIPTLSGKFRLAVRSDDVVVSSLTMDTTAGVVANFSGRLPLNLVDGQSHRIKVGPMEEPGSYLRHERGMVDALFTRRILASIDTMVGGIIKGWAFDWEGREAPIEIELWDGPVRLRRTVTNIRRNDVNTQFQLTGNHGFSIAVPAQQFDGLSHDLTLRAAGEELTVTPEKRLPQRLSHSLIGTGTQRFVGKVEHVTSQEVSGWAADLLDPFRPLRLAVSIDGVSQTVIVADQFHKRLQSVVGGGYHGFSYLFPSHVMNSTRRKVEVRVVDNNMSLPIGANAAPSIEIFFPLIDFFGAYEQRQDFADFSALPPTNIVPRPAGTTDRPRPTTDEPAVSIIVLNWNGAGLVEQLLKSIAAQFAGESVEVLLVDHGSTDDSLAVAEGFHASVALTVFARNTNYSFSASNNFAARKARGRHLFFVNNDLIFTSNCLPAMTVWLERDDTVGIVGMRLVEPLPKDGGGWRFATHHRGIQFLPKTLANDDTTYFPAELADLYSEIGAAFEMPAVTAAALLCRKDDFLAIGGFDEAYFYGLEDVDLCLRMAERLNKRIVCDTTATALHNRSFTRTARLQTDNTNPLLVKSQTQNTQIYSHRFKRRVVRKTLASLIAGQTLWRTQPLRVTFVVTDASFNTPAGDFYTAMEMAEAMRALFGWETLFVKRDVAELPGTDVLVVMRHDFALGKISSANPGLVTVAWIRNRVDEWLASPDWDAYNVIFCSSSMAISKVAEATGRTAHLLPIATNEERFRVQPPVENHRTDILFTGNYWDAPRDAVELLDNIQLPGEFAIYGHGWDKHEVWRKNWRRAVPYIELANIYPSAKLVIDDAHPVTREWNSLNSRIFDALGSGTLVVTNCRGGAEELFGDRLPTFSTAEDLTALLRHFMDHPEEREALAAQLHAEVLEKHTYKNRAQTFKDIIGDFVGKVLRFSIKVGIPKHEEKHAWGDWHLALTIQRALNRAGHQARIDILPEWYTPLSISDDAVIVLRGLSAYEPMASKINLLWLISHPDEVPFSEFGKYDHVFIASKSYTETLRNRLGSRVSTLLQCTDPSIFHPVAAGEEPVPEVLFVGNSRGVRRPIIDDALQMGINVGVYGGMWDGMIPHDCIRGTYIPNDGLRAYYANAKIVLNDHWPDMKREGFVSNRIFDAGACGATIISDDVAELREIFGDAVVTYDGAEDLQRKIEALLADEETCQSMGHRLREIILSQHTSDHRVQDILTVVADFV